MKPSLRRAILPLLLSLPAPALLAQTLAVKGLDPVALCRGDEVAGRAELTGQHERFTYRFASPENAAKFQADPGRYAIQFGGACARMGPLSGLGDPDRFLVHDGRIFVFASDACREAFRRQPERFVDPDVPAPKAAATAGASGAALLERAMSAHGGRARLAAWRSYRHEQTRQGKDMQEQLRVTCRWPDQVRLDHDYLQGDKAWRYWRAVTGDHGVFVDEGKAREMAAAARREIRRGLLHEPLFALRTAAVGDVEVEAKGKRTVSGLEVEEIELWHDRAVVTIGLDESGRVHTARFRGRGPGLWFGDAVLVFDDFVTVGGLLLPQTVRGTFDGKECPDFGEHREKLEVDADLSPTLFAAPQ